MALQITEITRRDIVDAIMDQKINVYGRLEEIAFLSRIWDLDKLPSYDSRHPTAHGDIVQHRIANFDWEDGWIFGDDRFDLLHGDDEIILTFLCESLHPEVRPDVTKAVRLCQLYNSCLKNDGYKLVETSRISGKPVYSWRHVGAVEAPGIRAARGTLATTDLGYIAQQITRMESSVETDPDLAIGTAKELVESCCKSILEDRRVEYSRSDDLPSLVKKTAKELQLTPQDIPEKAKAVDTIKRLLSSLATITQGLAELRGHYGTGHGRHPAGKGLQPRHAKLAIGAASTLAVFLADTHSAREPERKKQG
jgi:hypothetical protein